MLVCSLLWLWDNRNQITDQNAAWEFAMIDTGYGSEGFYFNDTGLQWNETDGGFNGWIGDCML